MKKAKDIEFYNQLFKISQQMSKGEAVDPSIKKALVTKVKNVVFLNSMDTEIEGIVGENKENIEALKTFNPNYGLANKERHRNRGLFRLHGIRNQDRKNMN